MTPTPIVPAMKPTTSDESDREALMRVLRWEHVPHFKDVADAVLAAGFRRTTTQQPQAGDNDKGKA